MQHDSAYVSSYDGESSNGIAPKFREWNSFIIGHPEYVFDHLHIKFQPKEAVPRDAQFIFGLKPTVILFYAPDFDNLPHAYGSIPVLESHKSFKGFLRFLIGKKDKSRVELSSFRYITAEYISNRRTKAEQTQKENYEKTPKQFVDAVGSGRIWAEPEDQGPAEFGGQLGLKALIRQQSKGHNSRLMEQIDKTMNKVIIALIIAIPFAILFIVIGGD